MGRVKTQSLQPRTLLYNILVVGAAVTCLAALFLWEQHKATDLQLRRRAVSLAEFLASQTQFAFLVGDRDELGRIAASALSNEDVLYVVFADPGRAPIIQRLRQGAPGLTPPAVAGRLEVIRQVLA